MTYTPNTEDVRDQYALDSHKKAKAFDNWLAEELRKAKETAWDEGHEDGAWNTHNTLAIERLIKPKITNPYRSQQ